MSRPAVGWAGHAGSACPSQTFLGKMPAMKFAVAFLLSAVSVVTTWSRPADTSAAVVAVVLNTQPPVHWAYPDLSTVELHAPDGSISVPRIDIERTRTVLFD